ncbi:hypothetical protein HNP84_002522 [Thermocatellispora tengchongensis]|uniref:CBU-0592-like domain-containing protein n=1 Tax=Thermocatellispora tengchongensis TaxID=1073253 RepID=A0A840P4L3_9ACTN|nr:hypothetical protein [Thermocatellispora tengchongensis]MBB5132801.1 hypothetical protein [Thermocatellispora tengchongensis]
MSLLIDVIGWAGAAVLLLGYGLVSTSRLRGDGPVYQVMNLAGAFGLMVNSAYFAAWPSAILNVIWCLIGVVALTRLVAARSRASAPAGPRHDG